MLFTVVQAGNGAPASFQSGGGRMAGRGGWKLFGGKDLQRLRAFEACIFPGANVGMYEDDFRLISTICIDEDAFV